MTTDEQLMPPTPGGSESARREPVVPEIVASRPHSKRSEPNPSDRKPWRSRPRRAVLALLVVVAAGAALFWYAGQTEVPVADIREVPLIRADDRPAKMRPEDPGGMKVAFRDKLVYRRLEGDDSPPTVERLLPEPEQPLPPPKPEPSRAEAEQGAPSDIKALAPAASNEAEAQPSTEASSAETAKPRRTAANSTVAAVPGTREPPKVAAKTYQIQLTAVRSQQNARDEWQRLRRKLPEVLGKLESTVSRADLGEKGIFYRLRAGPLSGEREARSVCAALAQRKIGCLVVRPGG